MTEQQKSPDGRRRTPDALTKAIQDEHAALVDMQIAMTYVVGEQDGYDASAFTYVVAAWHRVAGARARMGGAS